MKSNARKDPSRGEQAIDAFQHADRIDAQPRVKFGDDIVYRQEAKRARASMPTSSSPLTLAE